MAKFSKAEKSIVRLAHELDWAREARDKARATSHEAQAIYEQREDRFRAACEALTGAARDLDLAPAEEPSTGPLGDARFRSAST